MATRSASKRPRVLVDTTVLLAGTVWPRWPYEVLLCAARGEITLVLCPLLIEEANRKLAQKFPERLRTFETFLTFAAVELVEDPTPEDLAANRALMRDPNDIYIAVTAIKAGVDYLISEDKDFTHREASNEALHQQVPILLSGTFLRTVMGWTSKELEAVRGRTWSDLPETEGTEES